MRINNLSKILTPPWQILWSLFCREIKGEGADGQELSTFFNNISSPKTPHLLLPTASLVTTPCSIHATHHSQSVSVCALINPIVPWGSGCCSIGVLVCIDCKSYRMPNGKSIRSSNKNLTSSPTKKLTQ